MGDVIHGDIKGETMEILGLVAVLAHYLNITCVGLGAVDLLPLAPHSGFNLSKVYILSLIF